MKEKKTIIYIYDALCGWCYGFSSVIKALYVEHSGEYNFEVLSGGMVWGDRVGPISNIAPAVKLAINAVESSSGIVFGEPFKKILSIGTYECNSELASLALMAFKQQLPQKAVLFVAAAQEAFYLYGESLNDKDTYMKIAKKLGADMELYANELNSDNIVIETNKELDMVKRWGVTTFPALLLYDGKKLAFVSQGFVNNADILLKLNEVSSTL